MFLDKQIKKQIVFISISVIAIVVLFTGITYAYFKSTSKGEDDTISVGDLQISFCTDESCNDSYDNFGQIIGTKTVDGENVIEGIYPYKNDRDALKSTPYIFNVKNTGTLKSFITIKIKEDKEFVSEGYKSITEKYSNNVKIGISICNNKIDRDNVIIQKYSELQGGILLDNQILLKDEEKTYCLWTWLDENTPNDAQNTYFVANLDFKVEYRPR